MKKVLFYIVFGTLVMASSLTSQAQEVPDAVFWEDPQIAQLESMTPDLMEAIQRLRKQIKSVAISNMSFGDELSINFRKVATARLQTLLTKNPHLKISNCESCSQVRTQISGSFLKISRGIADEEYRKKMAEQLNVDGFIDIAIFMSKRQLSISLTVYEAKEGKIVFSEILTTDPEGKTYYNNFYVGKLTIPITMNDGTDNETIVDHRADIIGYEHTRRLNNWALFGFSLASFADDNDHLESEERFSGGVTGILLDGIVAAELGGSKFSMALVGGMGIMISSPLTSPAYVKVGLKTTVGDILTINLYGLGFDIENPKANYGYYLAMGWQF